MEEKILDYMVDYLINSLFCFRNASCPYCRAAIQSYIKLSSFDAFRNKFVKDNNTL